MVMNEAASAPVVSATSSETVCQLVCVTGSRLPPRRCLFTGFEVGL